VAWIVAGVSGALALAPLIAGRRQGWSAWACLAASAPVMAACRLASWSG
jgi:hypothetical protein